MATAPAHPDVIVIGGGLLGASIAYGLARSGAAVCILDEGDADPRASRANFALVWVHTKGMGMPEYSAWSKQSADGWGGFAAALHDETGIDVALSQPGGFTLCLSDAELEKKLGYMRRLHNSSTVTGVTYEVFDHAQTKRMMPAIGDAVVGSIYCPLDGHVNSLRLFRALHLALAQRKVSYRPLHTVDSIAYREGRFTVGGAWGSLSSPKIVLAAGLSNGRLGAMVDLNVPVRPLKGQVIITEKAEPLIDYPVNWLRQADEGGIMIGDSQEEAGMDAGISNPIIAVMAERAVRAFPRIADLNVVRTWTGSRVMTADGFPIYDESPTCPGAFVATCHSGVTLAASHALTVAPAIAAGALPPSLSPFGTARFHVHA